MANVSTRRHWSTTPYLRLYHPDAVPPAQLPHLQLEIASLHSQVNKNNDADLVKTSETQRYIEAPLLEDQAGDQYWQCQLNELEDSATAKTTSIVKTGREATSDLLKDICKPLWQFLI